MKGHPPVKLNMYIAGPMRGRPEFGFPEFDIAAARAELDGWSVFSPAARDRAAGFDPSGMTGNEDLSSLGFDLREALAADMDYICREADAIYMISGWESSSGARAEHATAVALGLDVIYE